MKVTGITNINRTCKSCRYSVGCTDPEKSKVNVTCTNEKSPVNGYSASVPDGFIVSMNISCYEYEREPGAD